MVRINISIDSDKLQELDRIRKMKGKSRSKFIVEAADLYIGQYKQKIARQKRKNAIKEAINIQNELREQSKGWDGVSEIRKWRESR